jgi:hypothetical protein
MTKSIPYLLVSIAFGCGPGPASKTADSSTSSGQGSTEGDSGSNIESQRQRFVDGCMQKAQSREYCECGFEQFKVVFKDSDLSKPIEKDDPRFAQVRDKTGANCASKLDPAQIEQSFVSTCNAGDERRNPYCTCAWTSLSKTMTPAEIVSTDTEGPRFLAAKKTMVVACKGKFPDDAAKAEFMTGCVQEQQTQAACTCLWKKLKAAFTTEEIVAGTVDVRTAPGLSDCK